ncbi:TetR/AcrR family transcriptional regulator [Streptomyces sp. NPDC059916]|uniref:TetR/AcrR family transcriptional regulator n=1 Tax=Streptomyces sp. NPDC059916 TaxID=3347001 RepID=UPI0036AD08A3
MTIRVEGELRNKQQMRTERSANRLLKAAAEIVVEGGVAALTLASVGERAGYSRGLVTTRFGSKGNLLRALVERMTKTWAAAHVEPRVRGKSGLDSLLEMMREMREQMSRSPEEVLALQVLLFDALNPGSVTRPPIVEYNANLLRSVESSIEAGMHDGTIGSDLDAQREARWVLEGIRGIGFHWLLEPDDYDAVAALTHLIEVVEARLGVS